MSVRHAARAAVRGPQPAGPVVARRAFTLVEIIVVLIIIVLLASVTTPRFFGNNERIFRNTCDQVADLLTMYAQREALGQKPVGLIYDPSRHWLMLAVYDMDPESGSRSGGWRWDPLVSPVKLPEFAALVEVLTNGEIVNIAEWPLASRPGQDRPTIEVALQGPSEVVRIVLPGYAMSPRKFRESDTAAGYLTPVDLNLSGRMREEW
jgi:prepilin-type N-terminal cleavage/methylation domain-containing protein